MSETRLAIQMAFIKVYVKKSYEKMNIKEVCLEAPVARTTFYEYYENLAELKAEIEDELVDGLLKMAEEYSGGDITGIDLTEYFTGVLDYIRKHWDENYAFLIAFPNFEYMEKWKNAIKLHFRMYFPEKTSIPNYGVISEVVASAVLGAYIYWMKHPDEVDTVNINEIRVKTMGLLPDLL